jgi:hypothetical protein
MLVDVLTDRYLDALLAGAQASPPTLLGTVERIEGRLRELVDGGRPALARAITQTLIGGLEQALEGVLARHGQLVVLPVPAHQSLQDLGLDQRWADFKER